MNYTGAIGSGTTWLTGDTDGDGDTDTVDLTTAIINFSGARNTAVVVPEPSALLLLVLAIGCEHLVHVPPVDPSLFSLYRVSELVHRFTTGSHGST